MVIFKKNEQAANPVLKEIDRTIVRGRVVDQRSGKALPYATIALHGTSLGSITNETGFFAFKIPAELSDPILVVTFMGYKNLLLPVIYPLEGDLSIKLKRETIPLQEVIIRYADPVKILSEAIRRIPENYLQEHSEMTAYYRESVKRNDHCMLFSEAILDVAKGPYSLISSKDHLSIQKGRKITDLNTEDTVILKLRSGIDASFTLDVVKNRPDFLLENFADWYELDFSDVMIYGERLVYVINFRQKSSIPDLLFKGSIYIDQENLAILAADFEFNPELIHQQPGIFLVSSSPRIRIRPVFARYHVDYRALDGMFHVSQVRAEVEMKIRKRRRWMGARYRIAIEMAITDVNPGERMRIKPSERVKPNQVLSDQPFQFDPLFWGIYNTIEPEATLQESLQKIEHNIQEITQPPE
ncbi:MAG: carboxypeptidase-like regulatory domain-containing protein [Bacteroides sp.]|nr:carboxypeptidase-like regulatory domain-containing protein [Bacteroides sp.]